MLQDRLLSGRFSVECTRPSNYPVHPARLILSPFVPNEVRADLDRAPDQPESLSMLVLWLDATSEETLTRNLEDVADGWNSRKRKFADPDARIKYVREVLSERQWLLVFDSCDDSHQFADIYAFIPPGDGLILITSRHADAPMLGRTAQLLGMDEREGFDLLHCQTEQDLDVPGL